MWHIELFGGLRMTQSGHVITRFKNTKNGALLAYLAFHRGKPRFRSVIIDLLWPDIEIEAGRNSLRVALNSIRNQLEPPGVTSGSILMADRMQVTLNPEAVTTDVAEFEAALRDEQRVEQNADERKQCLVRAVQLYTGELLPGWYEEWTEPERIRLADMYIGALRRLTRLHIETKEYDRAIEYARLSVNADPYREDAYRHLIELYAVTGRPTMALQQYTELERVLQESLGVRPSAGITELISRIREKTGIVTEVRPQVSATRKTVQESTQPVAFPAVAAPAPVSEIKRAGLQGALLPTTRFFGRERELIQLCSLLDPAVGGEIIPRLVTITGPGGCGKTRISMECARRLIPSYNDHVWFVSLGAATNAAAIAEAIVAAMQHKRIVEMEPLEQVISTLAAGPALLVLDNFEQLVEGGAAVVEALIARLPELRCLVTSQVRLGLPGAYDVPLRPLPTPEQGLAATMLLECPSAALFVDRAQQARPDFQITSRNVETIAALCRGMEGVPLAIELAAAWAQVMTPAQMLERLSDRFQLLVHPRKNKTDRHQALNRTIEWSYDLLSPEQQRFLTGLSVFREGWTAEAAAAVCSNADSHLLLWQLCDRSLIISDETTEGMRFRMLSSIREFAAEKAQELSAEQLGEAHAKWFREFASSTYAHYQSSESLYWNRSFAAERDNLDAALDFLVARKRAPESLELSAALWRFWYRSGHIVEGRKRLSAALAIAVVGPPDLRARATYGAARLATTQGDQVTAKLLYGEAIRLADAAKDHVTAAAARASLILAARTTSDFRLAVKLREEALREYEKDADLLGVAHSLFDLVDLAEMCNLQEKADAYGKRAAEIRELLHWNGASESDDDARTDFGVDSMTHHLTTSFLSLAVLAAEQGDFADSRDLIEDCMSLASESSDNQLEAIINEHMAAIALMQNDWPAVFRALQQTISQRLSDGDDPGVARCVYCFARMAAARNQHTLAAQLIGAASGPLQMPNFGFECTTARLLLPIMGEELIRTLEAGSCLSLQTASARAISEVNCQGELMEH